MPPFLRLHFLLLFLLCATATTTLSLTPDGLSLLSLKAAFTSPSVPDPLPDWNDSDADPCRWSGVSCAVFSSNTPRVVAVSVPLRNLSGYLPSELGALLYLRRLNLHGNRLTGPIPPALLNATALHSLFLAGNLLSGSIPAGICLRLPRLQNLDLSFNSLSGPLPPDLPSCSQLQRLLLAGNRLSGPLPTGIGSLKSLVQFDLSSNSLNGSLPPGIGNLSALTGTLNLSFNAFSGHIPPSLGRLPISVSLDLRSNQLTGPIPLDGSLSNQGPTSFLGNPTLCGFPLRRACKNPAIASPTGGRVPENRGKGKGLNSAAVIGISVGDAVAVAAIGVLVAVLYWRKKEGRRRCSCKGKDRLGKKGWCCILSGEAAEKGDACGGGVGNDENGGGGGGGGGEGELVAVDEGFEFELDELLRASAYVLGKGGMGIVYKVVLSNGMPVVVRRLGGEGATQRRREFASEVKAISRVRHRNIVRVRAYYWAPEEKLIVSDFISNGNLAAALHGGRSGHSSANLPWSVRLKIAKGTASGLAHIHECSPRKYIHGDIKPSNILLDSNFNPCISDFGLSRLIALAGSEASSGSATGLIGSALPITRPARAMDPVKNSKSFSNCYRAPDAQIHGSKPTQKWDAFSFGVVLLELVTGRSPVSLLATLDMDLVDWVRKAFNEEVPLTEILDPVLLPEVHAKKEIMSVFHIGLACTNPDPEARPKMKTVVESLDKIDTSPPPK